MKNNKCTCNDPSTYPMDKHDEAYLNMCGYCLQRLWDAAQPKINDYKGKIIVFGTGGGVPNNNFKDMFNNGI